MYEYFAVVDRVVDGDTLAIDVDLGCDAHIKMTVRLLGVNAPEHGSEAGDLATSYVEGWVENHGGPDGLIKVNTVKDRKEKYGRYLATVYGWNEMLDREDMRETNADRCLNEMLISHGHALAYDGGKR
jgi:micrococcal nuclease